MRLFLSLLVLRSILLCKAAQSECQSEECDVAASPGPSHVPADCTLVFAPFSSMGSSHDEWGIFSLIERSKGTPVWSYGDVVIQVPDANQELQESVLRRFVWNGEETGGQYEGFDTVDSVVPGIGMMTRTTSSRKNSNLLPLVPRLDEGDLTRFDSPGAGATTHYHNYTWFIRNQVDMGDELRMDASVLSTVPVADKDISVAAIPPVKELISSGYCLDNIRPRKSRIKDAGRGAFATRNLAAGSVIAPVPVLPLSSSALEIKTRTSKKSTRTFPKEQLLKNYCLGHANSTTLLYPYGPFVNLINHFSKTNVKFQWSTESRKYLAESISRENPPFLVMEVVATQDIKAGEELYLDYGSAWEEAWFRHTQNWKPADFHYTPSYVMDDAIRLLRTQQEQKDHEYPDNVFTSCFYRYSDRETSEKALAQDVAADKVTSFKWKLTKGLYDLKNLRPCEVLRRVEDAKGRSAYAVRMRNRPGLSPDEIIPNDALHIVTHVPRQAIRFSDKAGTTDQQMANAFRHEIGLPDDVFPVAWMDKRSNYDASILVGQAES